MNSQVIQTPIKFSIKTNNLDNIHKKVDKPLLKTSLIKPSSKLLHSNEIFTTMNFQDELEIDKSKNDKPLVNGIPLIKKHTVSDSSKKDVTLKRSLDKNSNDEMASKIRKFDNQEDTIIIESESSSKLVIHPLKNVKIIEPIATSKEVETVTAIFKALEEKISNIDKICKTNHQKPSKNVKDESKHAVNKNQEKSNKIVMKVNSNKCIIDKNKKIFSDDDYKEDRKHEELRKTNSKFENQKSNLKSLKECLIKERKRSNEINQEKIKSKHRNSKETERKPRDNNYRNESYKRDNYKERKHGNYDNRHNRRKSPEKSSKKSYKTLGEEIKSQSKKDSGKLNLIIKDEYHSQTTNLQSTIDLPEQELEDSFKLSNEKQCRIKDKLKIAENLKKLLDRKNGKKSDGVEEKIISKSSEQSVVVPVCCEKEENNDIIAPNSFEPTVTVAGAEGTNNNNNNSNDNLFSTSFKEAELLENDKIPTNSPDNKPSPSLTLSTSSSSFFVKTANISFKISPKKMQIGNIFSQASIEPPAHFLSPSCPPTEPIAVPMVPEEQQLEHVIINIPFKVPFNVDDKKQVKKPNISTDELGEEEEEDNKNNAKEEIPVETTTFDNSKQRIEEINNDLLLSRENDKLIQESSLSNAPTGDNIDCSKEQQQEQEQSEKIPQMESEKIEEVKEIKTEISLPKFVPIDKKHREIATNIECSRRESKEHSKQEPEKKSHLKPKKRSTSHSPSKYRDRDRHRYSRSKNQKSRSKSRSNSTRNRLKHRRRSREKSKSRKHRSSSRKSVVNHSRSRKYSNNNDDDDDDDRRRNRRYRHHGEEESRGTTTRIKQQQYSNNKNRDHSRLKQFERKHQRSKERSSRNHLRKENLHFSSTNRRRRYSKEKSKNSRKNSREKEKNSGYKSKQPERHRRRRSRDDDDDDDDSSRSLSKEKKNKEDEEEKYKRKSKISSGEKENIKTKKKLEETRSKEERKEKEEGKGKIIVKPEDNIEDNSTSRLGQVVELLSSSSNKVEEISCREGGGEEEGDSLLSLRNKVMMSIVRKECPSEELSQSDDNKPRVASESQKINIVTVDNKKVLQVSQNNKNTCETLSPVGIVSTQQQPDPDPNCAAHKQEEHSGASITKSIPIRITSIARDPRFNKDEMKSVGNNHYYLNDSVGNQPHCNKPDNDKIISNIIQPPPPPPPLPNFPVSVPYNIQFDQNAYLNSLNSFNFDLTNYFRNTAQCNSLNSTVPQNTYNTTNTYSLSNIFQQNSCDQSSFGQWYFPNEHINDTYNQYSINESFFNSANSFPVQSQPIISETGFGDNLLQDYNERNYQGYDEIDKNVSYNSTFPNTTSEDRYYQTLRYNSTNKKSSTSSLMNEVMDMDLASESCKSIDSHKVIDANDQMSDKDDLSSCGDFEYEAASPLDPFEKFPSAPKPKYEHIIETEVHPSALGRPFEYAYLKSTVCNCVPPNPDEIKLGKTACGENCFNRSIKVECNRKCPVYELCTNRRFQERIYAPFEPFYCTNGKGWGIRSTNRIYPGTFIIEYVGELIDFQEFLKRLRQKSTYNHHFIMTIQKNMYIDAGCKGNWSRFVNHSCDPNTIIERWVVNGKTRIGFFSKKMIEENEEITIDYQFQQYGMIEQKCFCNSANCTGVMGKLNEKLQDQIKTSHIKIRKELIQKIINRSCLKVINHVSDLVTVIKEEFPDRDTFYGFLEVLLRTDSEDCIRAFIECGGLKIITNFLDIISWNDWPLKLLYLKCLDHFKLKKRTILSSGQTAIQVVEYWSENPRYSLKHCQEEISVEKDLSDIENGQEFTEESLEIDRNTTIEFTLNDSSEQQETIETDIKDLAINIKEYFATEKQKFYIPKLKIVHSDSITDLNDSESKSKDSASRASSIQGDYVKSRKRRIRRRCTDVIRKLPKDEFRRLFSERHEKLLLEKTQVSTPDTISTQSNIETNSSEVFEVVKKLLSNVIIDEINRLKHSDKFATMPIEFQNLDLDKILSDLNIVGNDDVMSLINHNFDENKTSSASTYSNSSSRSLDDNSKSDLNGLVKNSTTILPPNWNSRKADNGQFYYYNIITKITQWEMPVYPWDAGEEDPTAYNFGNASDYQISREDVQIMYEEYKKRYKLQKIEERRKTRLERSLQRKLNLTAGEKNKIEFSKQVFRVVKTIVKPYNTSACKIGRIQHKLDLKFLCEKFADTIIGKEVKLVANLEDLEMNANVQSKIRTYIEKYMANQGRIYKRSSKIKPKSSKKLTLTSSSVKDCQTAESTTQLHSSDFNNSPDFSP